MAMSSVKRARRGPLADAGDRRVDDVVNIDVGELQLEAAGVDGGQVEDVVDDGEQGFRRGARCRRGIRAAWAYSSADVRAAEQLAETDDVGERGAQLVGHVADELVLQPVGGDEGFVALDEGALVALRESVTSAKVSSVPPSGSGVAA